MKKRIVIIGCGFGGFATYYSLHRAFHGRAGIEIVMINPSNYFLFTPLLHEVATGGVSPTNIVEPIRRALHCCLSDFREARVTEIDLAKRLLQTSAGEITYDYCIVAVGAETNFYSTPGAQEHGFFLKSLEDSVHLKHHIVECVERAAHTPDAQERKKLLRFVVIGGGATGVEIAAELSDFLAHTLQRYYPRLDIASEASVVLLQKGDELLLPYSPVARQKSLQRLRKAGVDVRFGQAVKSLEHEYVMIDGSESISTATPIWVAGVRPQTIQWSPNVAKDKSGRVIVEETLQLKDHPEVFAIGDCATPVDSQGRGLPMLAQVADRQGTHTGRSIVALLQGSQPKPFVYHSLGNLVSLGRWNAIAEFGPVHLSGPLAWWIWRTIYLFKIPSLAKKIEVAADWTAHLFAPRDISES